MGVQVKICGITTPNQAIACVEAGAHALGVVFYAESPRCVGPEAARQILEAAGRSIRRVGVFVDEPGDMVLERAKELDLDFVQLHGSEHPEVVAALENAGVRVIKALFANKSPEFADADKYEATGFLLESAGGELPGGNAMAWDWSAARGAGAGRPVVLAGGLNADNLAEAVAAAGVSAVDVSSGVERAPGEKDVEKIRAFLAAAKVCPAGKGEGIFK
ncbi:MAG: phosphoribosylanthranilate isomerase [Deltaproteobacteria bacterium]|nr:phosphoribosylanthranilate isomerase [Deltaproteobacteria bacterium]